MPETMQQNQFQNMMYAESTRSTNNASETSSGMIYNMIMMAVIGSLVTAMGQNIPTVINKIVIFFRFCAMKSYDYFFDKSKSKFKITLTITKSEKGVEIEYPDEYNMVLSQLRNKNIKNLIYAKRKLNITDDEETNKQRFKKSKSEKLVCNDHEGTYYFAESQTFIIDENIKIHVSNLESNIIDEKNQKQMFYQYVTISSNTYSIEGLFEVFREWRKECDLNTQCDSYNCVKLIGTMTTENNGISRSNW